jgi:hypothetical protein
VRAVLSVKGGRNGCTCFRNFGVRDLLRSGVCRRICRALVRAILRIATYHYASALPSCRSSKEARVPPLTFGKDQPTAAVQGPQPVRDGPAAHLVPGASRLAGFVSGRFCCKDENLPHDQHSPKGFYGVKRSVAARDICKHFLLFKLVMAMPAVIKVRDAAPCLLYVRSLAGRPAYEVGLLS